MSCTDPLTPNTDGQNHKFSAPSHFYIYLEQSHKGAIQQKMSLLEKSVHVDYQNKWVNNDLLYSLFLTSLQLSQKFSCWSKVNVC